MKDKWVKFDQKNKQRKRDGAGSSAPHLFTALTPLSPLQINKRRHSGNCAFSLLVLKKNDMPFWNFLRKVLPFWFILHLQVIIFLFDFFTKISEFLIVIYSSFKILLRWWCKNIISLVQFVVILYFHVWWYLQDSKHSTPLNDSSCQTIKSSKLKFRKISHIKKKENN